MIKQTPTRVVLYAYASGSPTAAAEFNMTAEGEVSLTMLDSRWGDMAQQYFVGGVPSDKERRAIPRTEGAAFMQALVEPRSMSYYRFIDESK